MGWREKDGETTRGEDRLTRRGRGVSFMGQGCRGQGEAEEMGQTPGVGVEWLRVMSGGRLAPPGGMSPSRWGTRVTGWSRGRASLRGRRVDALTGTQGRVGVRWWWSAEWAAWEGGEHTWRTPQPKRCSHDREGGSALPPKGWSEDRRRPFSKNRQRKRWRSRRLWMQPWSGTG